MAKAPPESSEAWLTPIHDIPPNATIKRKFALFLWTSTVILIRHAERGQGADPALTPAGQARSMLLAGMLQDANLGAVFVTDTQRSRQTGTPAALGAGLQPTLYDANDAAAPGAACVAELTGTRFDRMFVISRCWCGTRLLSLRYGTPTP